MSSLKVNKRWAWLISGVVMVAVGLVLAFMLVFATQNSDLFEPHFVWLFWTNVALASFLTLVIIVSLARLGMRLRRGKFGSRLLLKLAGIFAVVGVLPGLLIYTVSYQFVSRSIETWFDVRVEGALEAGLNLGRTTLDALSSDLGDKTRLAAERLADRRAPLGENPSPSLFDLERSREQLGAESVALINETGQVRLSVGAQPLQLMAAERVPLHWRQEARTKGVISVIEGLEDPGDTRVVALARMPDLSLNLQRHGQYLLVTQLVRPDLVRDALEVQSAYAEYQQRSLGRQGLRRMYIGTLTLALILAVFGALLLAAVLGQQLASPLLLLAEGVDRVAKGDLSPKAIAPTHDELGGLTRSFAAMTKQLSDARQMVERSVSDLDSARAHLQTILDNLTAGVIVFDRHGRIDTVNPGATRILRLPLSAYRGRPLSDVPGLQDFARSVSERFEHYASDPTPGERQQWQEAYELRLPPAPDEVQTLLVRGADLPPDSTLLVFDDISEVVSAQRAEAWAEVARRVAHEIKNPLTPIQLSAERLQLKLEDKLDEPSRQLLHRSVNTIVTQVQALKTLINEFRDYARLPGATLLPLDLNALVSDVLVLYGHALDQGVLRAELALDLPMIEGDATLLRQVVHNLVQNALDVVTDHPPAHSPALVQLRTDVSRHDDGSVRAVRLIVRDNGPGFSDKIIKRAFEPYITTKAKGTGLGLAVVKKIADEHHALVRIRNLDPAPLPPGNSPEAGLGSGAQVSLSFSKLSSTTPQAGTH